MVGGKRLVLNFDGSCHPNPGGRCGYGWVLRTEAGELVAEDGGDVPALPGLKTTNNLAEWAALVAGFRFLAAFSGRPAHLTIRGDSELVIRQFTGRWKCKAWWLRRYQWVAAKLAETLDCEIEAVWIPRERNADADALSATGDRWRLPHRQELRPRPAA